ncbi:MAG: DsbC family protein [Oleiphilaceae bacterium]|nr:DsbC family protein [Oleiphilaceae bacterium]
MQRVYKIAFALLAVSVAQVQAGEKEIRASLAKAIPSLEITAVEKSEIDGVYRLESNNNQVLFTNSDGSYFIAGELYGTGGGQLVNLTEERREQLRSEQLAAIPTSEKITFPAKGKTKARIAVFTDIDCGYCRKLHNEVPRMNELGIEVSYLAYPRAGLGSGSYKKIVSAWCADDKLQAMTDAKAGKRIPELNCENPVAAQFELGQQMGVSGTPAIFLEDGTLIPGYMPAERLAKGLGLL